MSDSVPVGCQDGVEETQEACRIGRASKVYVAIANVGHGGGRVTADLDILLIARYVLADEILPRRRRTRRRPRITDAELVCLAVAQILLDIASALSVLAAAVGGTGQVTKQDGWARSPESVVVTVSGGWSDVDT